MKIAVFMGGSSEERAISLKSGTAVAEALKATYPDVIPFDVEWIGSQSLFDGVEECLVRRIDIVFNTLHGGLGENGGVQAILEAAGLVYTGSGILASGLAMDKNISKTLFRHHGIPTADWLFDDPGNLTPERIERDIGFPCVVKPVDQGSSVGVSVVNTPEDLSGALRKSTEFGPRIMAERFIPGRELSVPILAGTPLPVIEICPRHGIYDYECKYTAGMSEYHVPAPIPSTLAEKLSGYALGVFGILGLCDIARIDFRLDSEGNPVCFEANTLPGMTATSLVPKSAAHAGIDFPGLVRRIVESACNRK